MSNCLVLRAPNVIVNGRTPIADGCLIQSSFEKAHREGINEVLPYTPPIVNEEEICGEHVEDPAEIGPALERAQVEVDRGRVALVNVKTDWRARASTVAFTRYAT